MKKSDQTKQKIKDAALTLISEKGAASTSTREIADLAEVSEATVFKYYKTKDVLLHSLFTSLLEDIGNSKVERSIYMMKDGPSYSSAEAYIQILKDKMYIFGMEVAKAQVLFQEILVNADARDLFYEKIWSRTYEMVNYIIERGKQDKVFVDVDTFYIRKFLFSMFFYTHSYELKLDPEAVNHSFQEQFDTVFSLVERALLNGDRNNKN